MLTPQLSAHFPRRYNKCVSRPPPHLASPRESLRVITPNTAPIRLQPGTAASRCMQGPPLSPDVPGTAPDRLSMHARAASQSQGARYGARCVPRVVGLVGLPRVVGRVGLGGAVLGGAVLGAAGLGGRVGLGGGDEERWPGMFS